MNGPQRVPKTLNPVSGTGMQWLTPNLAAQVQNLKNTSDKSIAPLNNLIEDSKKKIDVYTSLLKSLIPGSPNYQTNVNYYTSEIAKANKAISDAGQKIYVIQTTLQSKVKSILPKKEDLTFSGGGSGNGNSTGANPTDGKKEFVYKYNAPMVKSAYILDRPADDKTKNQKQGKLNSPQVESTPNDKLITFPGNYTDAKNQAWKPTKDGISGSKGVIQMSSWLAARTKLSADAKKDKYFTTQMHGFKFLYNPTTVSMSWGVNSEVNFQLESLGLDKSVPLSGGLAGSTVSFDLVLNRIGDMANLNENGLTTSTNPYPVEVDKKELKSIYKKGTMYDMEYLFRTINGFNAQYISDVNGLTADRGWLMALPVELILGDGLRYLVRITSMSVNHNIFNERMVPIFSTVSLTCTRFYDGSALAKFEKESKN